MKVTKRLKKFVAKVKSIQVRTLVALSLAVVFGFATGTLMNLVTKKITYSSYQACLADPMLQTMNQVIVYKELLQAKKEDLLQEVEIANLDAKEKELFKQAVETVYSKDFTEKRRLNTFIGCLNK